MTEIQTLEQRVKRIEMHIHNIMQTGRFHDEALTTLFERPDPANNATKRPVSPGKAAAKTAKAKRPRPTVTKRETA